VDATYPVPGTSAPPPPGEPRPAPTLFALFGVASHGGAMMPPPSRVVSTHDTAAAEARALEWSDGPAEVSSPQPTRTVGACCAPGVYGTGA
jgi:hypothetical protein